jgi:hexosaminidase
LTAELVPLSRNLSKAAAIGLLALDSLQNSLPVTAETQKEQLSQLKDLEKPEAVLIDMIVPSVEVLVQAAKTK